MIDQGSEFYNSPFKKWLNEDHIEMYSTYNEGKSVFAERFIRTIKNKSYKQTAALSINVYVDVLNDIIDKCKKTYHWTI